MEPVYELSYRPFELNCIDQLADDALSALLEASQVIQLSHERVLLLGPGIHADDDENSHLIIHLVEINQQGAIFYARLQAAFASQVRPDLSPLVLSRCI